MLITTFDFRLKVLTYEVIVERGALLPGSTTVKTFPVSQASKLVRRTNGFACFLRSRTVMVWLLLATIGL